ncbi:hypothetical protein JOD54_001980 [Actinokineospora baliensis]|uniref:hypothetical protein n=1 Tax=Actinokineospora baliensis TaxID=547056 RepID=UPI0019571DD7|nr:hypothetical protein [Actinokineospora baliensis]MBM7771776.1 hypothetical protein [Actinokineospora baliensis]
MQVVTLNGWLTVHNHVTVPARRGHLEPYDFARRTTRSAAGLFLLALLSALPLMLFPLLGDNPTAWWYLR